MMEIVGRYMLTERLAQGGAAEVFRARAHGVEGFRKAVAVKRLRRDVPADAAAEVHFAQTASLALSLQHANIVQAFDFGTTPSEGDSPPRHYLVMELMEGITLSELLAYYRATRGRMPLSVGAFVGAEIARALDYAHRRTSETGALLGLVHRDLSPANVMLSVEGEVKVTDFGVAAPTPGPEQVDAERTEFELRLTTVAGTSAYMSPEQARGESLTAASDVYSLGTIVYECLTGSNPFADSNPVETQRRVRASEVPPPELLYPEAPEALLAVLRAAMIADAAARTQRAGQLADELTWLCFEDADCSPSVALAAAVEAAIRFRTEPVESARAQSSRAQTPTNPPPPSMPSPSERVSARRVHATVVVVSLAHGDVEAAERAVAALEHAAAHIMLRDAPRVVAVLVHEDGAGDELERAVRSAWWISLEGQDEQARVGVASGIVTVEDDGVPRDSDELGALSRQAESAVPDGSCGVFLSTAVATAVRHAFRLDRLLDETETYRVLEAYGLNGRMGPFCGHRTELRTLWESLSRAAKGTTEVLHIKGPTGIGKTRLLLEHAARASLRLPDLRVEVTGCPKDSLAPFATIASLIEGWSHGNLAALGARLSRAGLKSADIDAALKAFEPSPPVPEADAAIVSLSAEPPGGHDAVVRFVQVLLTEGRLGGPLLLAFDDADAMDAQSCNVLSQVLRESEDLRASVVFLSRHALPAELQSVDPRRVDVFELERDPADRLALGLLEANTAPRDLLDFVWDSSRGQPRLVECLATFLRDAGHVRVQRGKATVAMALEAAALPLPIRMYFLSAYEQLKPLRRDMVDAVGVLGPLAKYARVARVLKALGNDETSQDVARSFGILAHRGLLTDTDPSALSRGLATDWATSLGGARRRAVVLAALATCEPDGALCMADEWLQLGDLAESVADLDTATRAYTRSLQIARDGALPRDVARAAFAAARVQREGPPPDPTHGELVKLWCEACPALEAFEVAREASVLLRGLERLTEPSLQAQLALAIARALRGRDAETERAQALTYALAVAGHEATLRAEVEAETVAITRQPSTPALPHTPFTDS